ncbi:hypothetical protein BBN03_16135 [Vibrio parahaemolyticus]|uniref:hypothetical protein n=1 Tax=Vibrio parahaemolyticus TaxID=670 RepID=UPI00084B47FB|nr:hypothetical protein [Vibrio parahaemolyticus]EJI6687438.1 hypothetical protein [Vibrio parahaemolyticus]OEA85403.1 hypothetical protein BBN03_16135 [Vibrio parahaemolyticus]
MVKDSLKVLAFFLFVVLFLFVYFGFNTVLLSGDENYASDTASKPSTTSKVNPVEGCFTYWTSESSRPGEPTRAYNGRRLNGERQYLVDHPTEGKIWVSHIRIEHDDCIWDLN